MTTNLTAEKSTEPVELAPNFKIPLGLLAIAIGVFFISSWASLPIAILSLFLTIQTFLIRLQFSESALSVMRSGKVIRSFPYSDWLNWEIFWQPVPILFYFKEVNNIHFLPIIFDAKTLADCLHKHYPRIKN